MKPGRLLGSFYLAAAVFGVALYGFGYCLYSVSALAGGLFGAALNQFDRKDPP